MRAAEPETTAATRPRMRLATSPRPAISNDKSASRRSTSGLREPTRTLFVCSDALQGCKRVHHARRLTGFDVAPTDLVKLRQDLIRRRQCRDPLRQRLQTATRQRVQHHVV